MDTLVKVGSKIIGHPRSQDLFPTPPRWEGVGWGWGGGGGGGGVGRRSWEDNWEGNVKFIESCCEETYFETCDKQQE